ncbi:MAG: Fe-S protein assembly co-chaperone HscB [Magnetococcales bacterium]|nr:Fe-S protein assembly co-chaperone HscB [Magnetococcales bacterium]
MNPAPQPCWSCRGPIPKPVPFCPTCQTIQPLDPNLDFFGLFMIKPGYQIDRGQVESLYRQLQQQFHPDRFATKSPKERRYSLEHVTRLNEAYRTLKDPLTLALYILQQGGVTMDEGHPTTPTDPAFLMEAMELREGLEELDLNTDGASDALDAMRKEVQGRCKREIDGLSALFDDYFSNNNQAALESAAAGVNRLRYHNRFLEELDQREESLF